MGRLKALKPRVQVLGAKPAGGGWAATSTMSTTERGYGWAWQQLRKRVLERDSGLCCACREAGRVSVASDVDHIRRKADGGTDDERNLRSLCRPCHQAKTIADNGGQRRPAFGTDGWPRG